MLVVSSKKLSCLTGIGVSNLEKLRKEITIFENFNKLNRLNEESKLVLAAAKNAFEDAKIKLEDIDPTKIGIVMSTMFGSFTSYENFYLNIKRNELRPYEFSTSLASTPVSALSIVFKLKGPCITLGDLKFKSVIDITKLLIESKICEIVLSGLWIYPSATLVSYFGKKIVEFSIVGIFESIENVKKRKVNLYLIV
ncbi:MAG: hypothetical protein N2643_05520 [Endomicrobia bacterium]|nr:hypothetical protein [Endomicrobiia bacterium]